MLFRFRTPITKQVPHGTTSTDIKDLTPRTSYTVSVSYEIYFINNFKFQASYLRCYLWESFYKAQKEFKQQYSNPDG